MDSNSLIKCFFAGIENSEYYNKKHNTKKSLFCYIMYYFWLVMFIILSKKKPFNHREIAFIYANIHERMLKDIGLNNNKNVYIGLTLKTLKDIKIKTNVLNSFSIIFRIKMVNDALKLYFKEGLPLKYLAFWIDFYLIYCFIDTIKPNKIIISGHFDRYATWISYLSNYRKTSFSIVQNGAIEKVELPNKIYCNFFYVFNKDEKKMIEKYIVKNKECKYIFKGFKSNIKFSFFNKKKRNGILIGIASQDLYTSKTIELIEFFLQLKINNDVFLIIYPHPREDYKIFTKIMKKHKNIYVSKKTKHINIDILITFFSTIVYDYLEVNKNTKIICYPPKNLQMSFFYNKNITIIKKTNELEAIIKDVFNNKKKFLK